MEFPTNDMKQSVDCGSTQQQKKRRRAVKLMCKSEGVFAHDWRECPYPTQKGHYFVMLRAFIKMDDWQELTIASANLGVVKTFQKWNDDGTAFATAENKK